MFYPCLCLYLGFFLLMTYNRPFLRTILQSGVLFFIDALTFILTLFYLYLNVILPFVKSYGDISSLTLSPGNILI